MTPASVHSRSQDGFTLLEIILILIIAGIFMGMLVPYLGTALWSSSLPISRANTALDLQRAAENMTADFISYPAWQANTYYAPNTIIVASKAKRNGYFYKTTAGGTSGSSEPSWPTPGPADAAPSIADGTVTWTECCQAVLNTLKTNLLAPYPADLGVRARTYGTYAVPSNKYVKWTASTPPQLVDAVSGDPYYMFEVRIQNSLGETITLLFACRGGA